MQNDDEERFRRALGRPRNRSSVHHRASASLISSAPATSAGGQRIWRTARETRIAHDSCAGFHPALAVNTAWFVELWFFRAGVATGTVFARRHAVGANGSRNKCMVPGRAPYQMLVLGEHPTGQSSALTFANAARALGRAAGQEQPMPPNTVDNPGGTQAEIGYTRLCHKWWPDFKWPEKEMMNAE